MAESGKRKSPQTITNDHVSKRSRVHLACSAPQTYTHSSLNDLAKEIRIIKLFPGERNDALRCSLFTPFDHPPSYQALSYTWGDASSGLDRIEVMNRKDSFMDITSNLSAALRDIRNSSHLVNLWVDAICIDQSNFEERTKQVEMMHHIFANAASVWISVGNWDPKIKLAFDVLHRLATSQRSHEGLLKRRKEVHETLFLTENNEFKSIEWFLSLNWWTRVWVIQEITFSQQATFICGKDELLWQHLSEFVEFIEEEFRFGFIYGYHDKQKKGIIRRFGLLGLHNREPKSLYSLIDAYKDRQASLPQDKVYALLNLTGQPLPMRPDYNKTISEVYADATKVFIAQAPDWMASLDHLGTGSCRCGQDMPSWVSTSLHWTEKCATGDMVLLERPHPASQSLRKDGVDGWDRSWSAGYHSDGGIRRITNIDWLLLSSANPASCELTIFGLSLDSVQTVGRKLRDTSHGRFTSNWEDLVRRWEPQGLEALIYEPTGQNGIDAFCCTLLAFGSGSQSAVTNYSLPVLRSCYDAWTGRHAVPDLTTAEEAMNMRKVLYDCLQG